MRVLAVDPGLRSGMATWYDGAWAAHTEDPMPCLDWADIQINDHGVDLVVCESYKVTMETAKKSQQLWSLELIGALRWMCHASRTKFELQAPSAAKNFVPDARLRQMEMWTPGKEDHARDATRHLILALAKAGQLKVPPLSSE